MVLFIFCCHARYYIMGRKAVMKAWAQDGSDVPKKIITKNTLGYKSPGSQEQTLEMKDKDEEAQIKNGEKNQKTGHPDDASQAEEQGR